MILCSLVKIKETRENAKSKNISCDVDFTNGDLQNEDYLYIQPSNSETGSEKEAERNVSNKRGKYIRYSAVQRYEIGNYASECSAASTLQKYKGKFPQFNESTVRSMPWKYKEELRQSLKEKQDQRLSCLPKDLENHFDGTKLHTGTFYVIRWFTIFV